MGCRLVCGVLLLWNQTEAARGILLVRPRYWPRMKAVRLAAYPRRMNGVLMSTPDCQVHVCDAPAEFRFVGVIPTTGKQQVFWLCRPCFAERIEQLREWGCRGVPIPK